MGLIYQKERFRDIMPELPALFVRHWQEIANDKDTIQLEPAWDRYLVLEDTGILHVLTVRDEGTLVGYFFAIVHGHLHYASSLTAWSDIFILMPEYRLSNPWAGVRLFKEADKMLRDLGVQKVYIICKVKHDLELILTRLGYVFSEKVFTKTFKR